MLRRYRPWLACLFVYFFVFLFNDGMIGVDEYWVGVTRYIPAQTAEITRLVDEGDVKSPTQLIPFHLAAQTALGLGIESGYGQYRFVLVGLGLLNLLLTLGAFVFLACRFRWQSHLLLSGLLTLWAFHLAVPGLVTRGLFESNALPWVTWVTVLLFAYDQKPKFRFLAGAVLAFVVGFWMRPQILGLAALFLVLPLLHRRFQDLWKVAGMGLLALAVSGVPDWLLRGMWHHSLWAVTSYNLADGEHYGRQPWYFFFPLIFVFLGGPFVFLYSSWRQRRSHRRLRVFWLSLGFFLLPHLAFANKFERFLIPILGVMAILLTLTLLQNAKKLHTSRLWKMALVINLVLWLPASFAPAQKNIITLARWLKDHPEVEKIYVWSQAVDWLPDRFSDREIPLIVDNQEVESRIKASHLDDSSFYLLVREAETEALPRLESCEKLVVADVNPFDAFAYKMNRKNNLRRSPLGLWRCPSQELKN